MTVFLVCLDCAVTGKIGDSFLFSYLPDCSTYAWADIESLIACFCYAFAFRTNRTAWRDGVLVDAGIEQCLLCPGPGMGIKGEVKANDILRPLSYLCSLYSSQVVHNLHSAITTYHYFSSYLQHACRNTILPASANWLTACQCTAQAAPTELCKTSSKLFWLQSILGLAARTS